MRELEESGCAMIRGAIPLERVLRYRDALDGIYARSEAAANGDVDAPTFTARTALPFESFFDTPAIAQAARATLGAPLPFNGTLMSVSANQANSFRGIQMHTDGIIQGTQENILCVWAPLHACGEFAPGLALIRAGRERTLAYLRRHFIGKRLPGWHSTTEWNSTRAFTLEALREEFGEPWAPVMNPGDVLLFTNWTIHCSHITPEMTERRSAAIYRLRRKRLRERIGNYQFQFLRRLRRLKSLVRGNVA